MIHVQGKKKYFSEPHNCISDITHYYYSEENNIYKRCYERCYSCYSKSTANEHNCNKCETQYHFIIMKLENVLMKLKNLQIHI